MSEHATPAAGAFVVIAEFRVKPGSMDAFLAAALDDARHSVADEPGCRQFDVIVPEGDGDAVVFYEVYDSRAAFDAHLETPHLDRFRAAFPALITEERPVRFSRRHHP
ncbi:putative quinol monooxygenase [Methylobrevis pamukkalensis]|uniref:Putative monooxygenase n=1 Tax=Methylobrevis pamukkalensis TaxID=1439726 RepID=A0A1E3H142_9HYPH|nr:putative quinol monooxygenase [Methylobrevis pamukkalensis]ODN69536.1 putative monooxygenase [Methylobrevis pamukkalensis]